MKKILNGIRFDTEKAVLIGESGSSGLSRSDFRFWEAGLYVTPRSGRYFLAGEGGAMTRFAQRVGDMTGGGSDILPMTKDEALSWAEANLTTEEVEQHFADMLEDA